MAEEFCGSPPPVDLRLPGCCCDQEQSCSLEGCEAQVDPLVMSCAPPPDHVAILSQTFEPGAQGETVYQRRKTYRSLRQEPPTPPPNR